MEGGPLDKKDVYQCNKGIGHHQAHEGIFCPLSVDHCPQHIEVKGEVQYGAQAGVTVVVDCVSGQEIDTPFQHQIDK